MIVESEPPVYVIAVISTRENPIPLYKVGDTFYLQKVGDYRNSKWGKSMLEALIWHTEFYAQIEADWINANYPSWHPKAIVKKMYL